MRIMSFLLLSLFVSCVVPGTHEIEKDLNVLSSLQGQTLLKSTGDKKLATLKTYWEAQRKNYCGVCSTVVAQNYLAANKKLNQDNFFVAEVSEGVIRAEVVAKMGLTLREIREANRILAKGKYKVIAHYAHLSGLDFFRQELKRNSDDVGLVMIVNFSRQSLAGTGMRSGHFSLVAEYDEKSRQVLILGVQGSRESFWVSDRDLYDAMLAIDPVSKIARGWLSIEKEK